MSLPLSCALVFAQLKAAQSNAAQTKPAPPPATEEQEPPEEDPDLKPKVYEFNPLEAQNNITAGNYYYKKGNYRAASRRYLEATKWDPASGEALVKLAESDEKMREFGGAREAYTKYLALDPPPKDSDTIKKRLAKLPRDSRKK
jgi:tetratricopeptide (TPR) repeat protein